MFSVVTYIRVYKHPMYTFIQPYLTHRLSFFHSILYKHSVLSFGTNFFSFFLFLLCAGVVKDIFGICSFSFVICVKEEDKKHFQGWLCVHTLHLMWIKANMFIVKLSIRTAVERDFCFSGSQTTNEKENSFVYKNKWRIASLMNDRERDSDKWMMFHKAEIIYSRTEKKRHGSDTLYGAVLETSPSLSSHFLLLREVISCLMLDMSWPLHAIIFLVGELNWLLIAHAARPLRLCETSTTDDLSCLLFVLSRCSD